VGEKVSEGRASGHSREETSIAWMLKQRGDAAYLFAVNMRNRPARGTFTMGKSIPDSLASATVLDESRQIPVRNGAFADDFKPYEVHLYQWQRNRSAGLRPGAK
jgi:hypothetical protein